MNDSFLSVFEDAILQTVMKAIENGTSKDLSLLIDTQLKQQPLPDWYKSELISNVYYRLKQEQVHAKKKTEREKAKKGSGLIQHYQSLVLSSD